MSRLVISDLEFCQSDDSKIEKIKGTDQPLFGVKFEVKFLSQFDVKSKEVAVGYGVAIGIGIGKGFTIDLDTQIILI